MTPPGNILLFLATTSFGAVLSWALWHIGPLYLEKYETATTIITCAVLVALVVVIWWLARTQSNDASKSSGFIEQLEESKKKNQKRNLQAFEEVGGNPDAVENLKKLAGMLTPERRKRYNEVGAKTPRAAILSGPPGTGKGRMVALMAAFAGVAMVSVSGSAFMNTYVGVGASTVRELFAAAAMYPACIILIDEIDSFGGARDGSGGETSLTLNQFLTCLDALPVGVLVVATTNLLGSLSGPLMRAGRFGDRVVVLEKPDLAGRAAIFQIYMLLHLRLSVFLCPRGQINPRILAVLAALTVGMVGADLEKIVNEAAIRAGDRDVGPVRLRDLLEAVTAHRKELQLLPEQPAVERGVGRAETLVAAAAATE